MAQLGHPETLVFPADETGHITSGQEVAGGPGVSIDEALGQLVSQLVWY